MMRGSISILLIGLFCFGCFACKDDKDEVTPIEEEEVYLDVNPTSLSFESDGGEKEVSINSNGSWNIDFTGISWVRPNISVSKGNAIVKFTADKNNSTTNRSAAITVSAQGAQPVRLQLTQAPQRVVYLQVKISLVMNLIFKLIIPGCVTLVLWNCLN